MARAGSTDAAHLVWMAKANQLYNLEKEQSRIKAKLLFLIEGSGGHLDGIFSVGKVAERIKAFLEK